MTIFLGFGALQFVGIENIMAENKAGNTAAPLLAQYLGGEVLMSFISAVAFATILAVDSGLVLTGASAISHDIYGEIIKNGKLTSRQQVAAARSWSISIAILSIFLALFAQSLNVSFAFCIGASANLPVIIYTIYWKKFNSTGAVAAIFVGKPLVDLAVPSGYHYAVRFLSGIYRISNWCEKT